MLKVGAESAQVRKYQEALIAVGYPLPKYGADGDLGGETLKVFENWWEDTVLQCEDFSQGVPDRVLEALMIQFDVMESNRLAKFGKYIMDVRDEAWEGAEKGSNSIERIDTICLHQMAIRDSDYQGWERWRKLAIHFMVSCGDNAKAYLLHDLNVRVWHGHAWNRRSVGFELEGWFSGIGTNKRYFWQPKGKDREPMVPTEQQLAACHDAIRYSVSQISDMGGQIKYIGAHRQSYATKESDPGSLIWQGVALPMMEELGLVEAPTLEKGSPIPEAWDPRNVGVPYR